MAKTVKVKRLVNPVAVEDCERTLPDELQFLRKMQQVLPTRVTQQALPIVLRRSQEVISTASVVWPDKPDVIVEPLRIAADVSVALFVSCDASAENPKQGLLLGTPIPLTESPLSQSVDIRSWLQAYFLNLLVESKPGLDTLCIVDFEEIAESGRRSLTFIWTFAEAARAYWQGSPDAAKRFQASMDDIDVEELRDRTTSPGWYDLSHTGYVLACYVPLIAVFLRIIEEDQAAFDRDFLEAVKQHKKFWTQSKTRKSDWNGFVSIELSALAKLARTCGLNVNVESEYLLPDSIDSA